MKKISFESLKSNKLDLVILAGGKGTRIKQYLKGLPKPMAKFNNKHFLQVLTHLQIENINQMFLKEMTM